MNTLFRITHSAPFNISIQALVLIEKVSSANQVCFKGWLMGAEDLLLLPSRYPTGSIALYTTLY